MNDLPNLHSPTRSWDREDDLVDCYLDHIGDGIDTRNDYLLFGRAPDIIRMDANGNLHTIEAKLKNWKQAILQCETHIGIADFAWILIPKPKPEWVAGTVFGLIDAGTFQVVVPAKRSDNGCLSPFIRERYISHYWPTDGGKE